MTAHNQRASASPDAALGDIAARVAASIAHARQLADRHAAVHSAAADAAEAAGVVRDEVAATRTQLQEQVAALAAALRRDGAPPERMVVAIKEAVQAATPPDADARLARELMSGAVRWGIEAYYAS